MIRALASLALLALAACTAGAQTPPVAGGRLTDETIQHDGRERRFLVHDFSAGTPAPVVIVLHGGGGHPENAVSMSQMDKVASAREVHRGLSRRHGRHARRQAAHLERHPLLRLRPREQGR